MLSRHRRPIAVLMVTGTYYPEVNGGAIQCQNLVKFLRGAVSFAVLTTSRNGAVPRGEHVDGVPVWRVPLSRGGWVDRLRALFMFIWYLLFSPFPYQILHLNGFSLRSVAAVLAARARGRRTVLAMHTPGQDDPQSQRGRSLGLLRSWIYQTIDRYVAVSPALSSRYLSSGLSQRNLLEIPNGVDLSRFRPPADRTEKLMLRERLGLPKDVPVILYVGFFSFDKAPNLIIRSWLLSRERGLQSFLVMIGSTDTRYFEIQEDLVKEVHDLISSSGVASEVRFVEQSLEIELFYRTADVFVLPSLREGCPMALLEAMASGLPCIASRLPGATDVLIENGVNGILTRPADVEEVSRSIHTILENPGKAEVLGRKARATIQGRYSIEQTASTYLQCYEDLLRSR